MTPRCDFDHEDSKSVFMNDTLVQNDAFTVQSFVFMLVVQKSLRGLEDTIWTKCGQMDRWTDGHTDPVISMYELPLTSFQGSNEIQ